MGHDVDHQEVVGSTRATISRFRPRSSGPIQRRRSLFVSSAGDHLRFDLVEDVQGVGLADAMPASRLELTRTGIELPIVRYISS